MPRLCTGAVDPDYTFTYVPGWSPSPRSPLTVTASGGTMTYGGPPPAITPGLRRLRQRRHRLLAETKKPTCSTSGDQHEPGGGSPYRPRAPGAVDPNYAFTYVGGSVTVAQAPLEVTASSPRHDLRQHTAGLTPTYSRLQERRQCIDADDAAHLHDHGHEREPALAADLPVLVLGRVAAPTTPSRTSAGRRR